MRSRDTAILAALLVVTPFLGGSCENATSDPGGGGYFDGLCGLRNGTYERRLIERRNTLDELDSISDDMSAKLKHARRRVQELDQMLPALRLRTEAIRRSMHNLDIEIERLGRHRSQSQEERLKVEAERDKLALEAKRLYDDSAQVETDAQTAGNSMHGDSRIVRRRIEKNLSTATILESKIENVSRLAH